MLQNLMNKRKTSNSLNILLKESEEISKALPSLVNLMQKVDIKSPDAVQNELSIADNNGDRIKLNREPKTIKK